MTITSLMGSLLGRWMSLRTRCPAKRNRHLFRPSLETLEERFVPYALAGTHWAITNVSASFLPDGTTTNGGAASNLFASLNAGYATATWQREFARALQTWANVSPLNFHLMVDSGAPSGTSGSAQGDSRFGDIRFGGYPRSDGYAAYTYYPSSTTLGGDQFLATNVTFYIGSYPDLYSVLLHETGHSLGLAHSTLSTAVMYPTIMGVYNGLTGDDIAGIQAIYGTRQSDGYDASAANDSSSTASVVNLGSSGGTTFSADLTSLADVDYYRVTAPASGNGTLTVSVDARNLSLLTPKVAVYDVANNLVATADAGSAYGSVATVNLSGLIPGQTYTILADGATTDVFGMGAYQLNIQFGGVSQPPPPPPPPPPPSITADRFEINDTPSSATNFGKTNGVGQTGLTLHTAADVDYFTFIPAKSDTYTLSVTPSQGSGTLNLTVLNAQQTAIAGGQSSTGGVTVTANLTAGQSYFVKVNSPSASLLVYNLGIAKATGKPSGGGGAHGGAAELGDGTELANPAPETAGTEAPTLVLTSTKSTLPEARAATAPGTDHSWEQQSCEWIFFIETAPSAVFHHALSRPVSNDSSFFCKAMAIGAPSQALVDSDHSMLVSGEVDPVDLLDAFWRMVNSQPADEEMLGEM